MTCEEMLKWVECGLASSLDHHCGDDQARRGDAESPMDAFLLDWRPVEGVTLPRYVEIAFGTGMYSVRWDEVELMRETPEELFEVPAPPAPAAEGQ